MEVGKLGSEEVAEYLLIREPDDLSAWHAAPEH